MKDVLERLPLEKLVSRQIRLWEGNRLKRRTASAGRQKPCITLSREMGCPGLQLAEALASRLEWSVYDKSLVEHIAANAHVQKRLVESFDEKTQNEIHNWVATLIDRSALGSDKYFKHLVTVMTSIARHGEAIIIGRGGNFILDSARTLRIRLVAPLSARIRNVMQHRNIGQEEAEAVVRVADLDHAAFIRRFFHRRSVSTADFDMTLNLETLTLPQAEGIIVAAVDERFPQSLN